MRVISCDGGGIRGLLTADWLAAVEAELGGRIRDHCDLIAGTSTGAILAVALGQGISAAEIAELYVEHGGTIFPGGGRRLFDYLGRMFKQGISAPKYSADGLERVLCDRLGYGPLSSLTPRVMLMTYNTVTRSPEVLKSWVGSGKSVPAWEAAVASASAPTYFPAHIVKLDGVAVPLIDGGVAANNPTVCAIAEAMRLQEMGAARSGGALVVGSFGAGRSTRPISAKSAQEWGAMEWALPIIDVLLDAGPSVADYQARMLVTRGRYFRFQTRLEAAYDDIDDVSATNLNALRMMAMRHLRDEGGDLAAAELAALLKSKGN